MKKVFRNCPDCQAQLGYSRKADYNKAVDNSTCCRKCKNKPKTKQCDNCQCDIIYKTRPKDLCNKCKKEKLLNEAGTRQCPQCDTTITYNTKYDRITAEHNNSICPGCRGKINSQLKQGKNYYDILISKGVDPKVALDKYQSMESKRLATRDGYKHSKQTKDKISETAKGWQPSDKTRKAMSLGGFKRFEDPKQREKTSKARLKVIAERPELEKQRAESAAKTRAAKEARGEYTGGTCKNFIVGGLRCQGNWERMYIEGLINDKTLLPTKAKPIKTPLGYYTPDFEFKDRYVEIKCLYTFDVCIGKEKGWGDKSSTAKQLNKIIWVHENVKPVCILILDKQGQILERIDNYSIFKSTKTINLMSNHS